MIARILEFSLHQRVLVGLLTLVVAGIGVLSLTRLPMDAVPDITNNQVQIMTEAPAFSPVEIEQQVTYPLETALAGIPGLESTRSLSRNGFSQITAVFTEDTDIYFARQQVGERLAQAREGLPREVEPRLGAISTGLGEIYMWTVEYAHVGGKGAVVADGQPGWQSDGSYRTPEGQRLREPHELATYLRTVQDWMIRPQIKGVKGVAEVDAIGGYAKQYHVAPDPEKLLAYGLSFADLVAVLEANNRSIGAGFIERNGEAYVARADGRIRSVDDIGTMVIANRGGIPIYLRNVADIAIGKELRTGSASQNGTEIVVGTAMMLIGENSRTVSGAVDDRLRAINTSLPPDIRTKTVLNRTTLVESTIATVQKNLTEGALLVVAVLFVLLGNLRAALLTALVIPLAMLMTATGMLQLGISGNLMSLGALDFGLIVDGAVIITENCLRRLAERQQHHGRLLSLQERLQEVLLATREMIEPTVFGQAIIIMVYVPLLSFTGVEGKMFEPMAMTVILALVAAFLLSLTFVPAMIALFVTGRVEEKESRVIAHAKRWYAPRLAVALAHPGPVIAGAAVAFMVAVGMFFGMGREFIPTLDEKDVAMHAMRIPSTSLSQSQAMQFAVEKAVSAQPEVDFVFSKTGTAEMAADPMPPNVSDTFIIFKPRKQWPDPRMEKTALIERLGERLRAVPGNNYEFTQPIQMRFNELISGVRSDVAVKLFGEDFAVMERTAQQIAAQLQQVDGAEDVKIEQTSGLPMLDVTLNKEAIARYGMNTGDVLDVVAIAIGGRPSGTIFEGDKRFDLVVRLPDAVRADMTTLNNLPILLPELDYDAGPGEKHARPRYVPLREVATLRVAEGPNQISRENGKRRVVIQANVRGRDIGSFVAEAQARMDRGVKIPTGYWLEWGGQFRNLQEATARLLVVVPACFLCIFLLLFTALKSARQALLVFTGVPLALTGGILALWLRGMPFSISAAVGFIALSGVAVLNGLVLINRINQLVREGVPAAEAVREGALSRLRPVLMTALVASLGFVPMAIAVGAGAEVQKPLATVVIGGLITATLLTLFVVPTLYRRFRMAASVTAAARV
jgi:cobalt-zinc-cadmium resistance protein CzcA